MAITAFGLAGKEAQRPPIAGFAPEMGSRELAARYQRPLNRLRAFYNHLATAHLAAGVWLNVQQRAGEGTFETWLDRPKYRTRFSADARLGLASGLVAAYDGERYQLLFEDDSRLSLYRQNPGQIPAPFMNPFYLPVAFLSPEGDTCPACELTLGAIADEKRWRSRVGAARGLPEKGGEGILILPGGQLQGGLFSFRVTILMRRGLVSRIESIRPSGKVFRVVELTGYRRVAGTPYLFPHHMLLTGFDDKGNRQVGLDFKVESLEVNQPIGPEKFTIPFSAARTVLDEDRATFLQRPPLKEEE